MSVGHTVKAVVYDLRGDMPKAADKFYVDTNAWFWTVYSNVQFSPEPPKQYQIDSYPEYLKKVLSMGANLYWCGLSLSELAHRIECVEFRIFLNKNPSTLILEPKEYRHKLKDERTKVVDEIKSAWGVVETMATCIPVAEINATTTSAALKDFEQLPVDGYDLFSIQALKAANITQVVSDDGDFCSVPGIKLFTANQTVLDAAKAQGRLSRR